ncbi:MAG TPA: SpoIIE family protein phosphatase, partial [Nitrosopumilaceae archaeon]|nr:SpoIIE family protein phosphatase [Nitrosopumilaceae archaeon]
DSINYAQRIQTAVLPEVSEIKKHLPESFVLYKPKDIVSGDFYYFHLSKKLHPVLGTAPMLIAVADCTGHGVPGALMSVISYQKLDETVNLLMEPKNILKRLNKRIKSALKQTSVESSSHDGLDIALVTLNKSDDDTTRVKYAGANRPVWIIKSLQGGNNSYTLEEIKATKAPIGGFTEKNQDFEQHELIFKKGDVFYLFSDGYADQFGGNRQKKLTSKRLKEVFLSIQELSMDEQHDYLDKFITDWRGDSEQVDDILIIGIKC